MSKEVKTQEPIKSNKKYVILALVVILGAIGIISGNSYKDEETTTKTATTKQTQVTEKVQVVEDLAIARVDIYTKTEAAQPPFEVYVDGSEEPWNTAGWMPKFGSQGYVVEKDDGVKDIMIKVLSDAKINIVLKGHREEVSGNLIPHWVKYTTFTINDEPIITEPLSIWYGKPFSYTIDVKAGEIYKIHVVWTKTDK